MAGFPRGKPAASNDRGNAAYSLCKNPAGLTCGPLIVFAISFDKWVFKENSYMNIVLVMSDDQGWGQMGYMNHPLLKTKHLNEMAENGLRFNRFYAGAPVCSPTRASVLTGRCNDRTGVYSHGWAMRQEETTLPQIMKDAGYATGHFGKWHLNGIRGAGVPIFKDDPYGPGKVGFDTWLSVTNFFDIDPVMSRNGEFEEFRGDSSDIIVEEALQFLKEQHEAGKSSFTVIWYGSPHNPFYAYEKDIEPYKSLESKEAQRHHGEIHAMDRSIGTLRRTIREMGIEDDTLIWFNSDNGGLKEHETEINSVGGLRDYKSSMYEGGLRVPCIVEWPENIKPNVTDIPASTADIMPTILDIAGIDRNEMLPVVDGESIRTLLEGKEFERKRPLKFHFNRKAAAIIDGKYKIIQQDLSTEEYELFDLDADFTESNNIFAEDCEISKRMLGCLAEHKKSVQESINGDDYPNGIVFDHPEPVRWFKMDKYKPYFKQFIKRKEYKRYTKELSEFISDDFDDS